MMHKNEINKKVAFYVLFELSMDWISLYEFAAMVDNASQIEKNTDLKNEVLRIVEKFIDKGIFYPGYTVGSGFEKWENTSKESVAKIRQELDQTDNVFDLLHGEICWFDASPTMTKYGEYLVRKYAHQGLPYYEVYDNKEKEIIKEEFLTYISS